MAKTIFLSYSSKDKKSAGVLQAALERPRWKVWRDEISIKAGDNWSSAIDMNLRNADAVVVLVTPVSAASPWVVYEYAFATGAQVPVVAVSVGNSVLPDPIRKFQVVSCEGSDVAQRVLKQIRDN